jgi:hypothetical protein
MPSDPNRRPDWRTRTERWLLRREIARLDTPVYEGLMGRCHTCQMWRGRREVTQVERDEVCVYACRVCGDVIDHSPPF